MGFGDYIYNKDVILVSPSSCLIGLKKGIYIDSFDVVVKTNGMCLLSSECFCDYGSRLDVLYVNVQFMRDVVVKSDSFNKVIPKFVCCKNRNKGAMNYFEKYSSCRVFHDVIMQLGDKVKGLLTGTAIIKDILRFKPKVLYIIGMDLYVSKPSVFVPDDWREYVPGYIPDLIASKANIKNVGRIDPHDYKDNARYINELANKHKNLVLDDITANRISELLK